MSSIGKNLGKGIISGLTAGIIFGIMMSIMTAPTPEGGKISMMLMVANIVHSTTMLGGWIYHLFNSAVIGAIYGWLLSSRSSSWKTSLTWGATYGFAWWILGALILMPIFLGMPPFAPLMMEPMRMVAIGSLVGHLIFGLVLGGVFYALRSKLK